MVPLRYHWWWLRQDGVVGGRLAAGDVACWVIKAVVLPPAEPRLARCVRRSYRLELMAPGQRCLLWLSGRREPGVHALGRLASVPEPTDDPARHSVEVELHRLAEPVPRAELVADPAFAAAEVVRMPAGSNPSWLSPAALRAVLDRVDPAALDAAGWR